jgi:hypothetical protein
MTNPSTPEEPGFYLRMIFNKLEEIDRKVDGQSEKLATHEVRLVSLEDNLKSKSTGRQAMIAGLVSALIAGVFTVMPLFIR